MKKHLLVGMIAIGLASALAALIWVTRQNEAGSTKVEQGTSALTLTKTPAAQAPVADAMKVALTGKVALYQSPSVVWETKYRTIGNKTVAYEFGKGNPPEVALEPAQYRATKTQDGIPYVTPEAELALKALVEEPRLRLVIEKCRSYFAGNVLAEQANAALDTKNLSLENMLYIDGKTQRKEIRWDMLEGFGMVITQLRSPLSDDGSAIAKQCLIGSERQYLAEINELFAQVGRNYLNSQGVSDEQN